MSEKQWLYPCTCSRKSLLSLANHSDIYPGICRDKKLGINLDHALRIKTGSEFISFHDQLQGVFCHNLASQHGDFILKRKDHIIAYQFAVVIDDHIQQITHVVRGVDLLDSTPKQIYLQKKLGLPTPQYAHVPVIVDADGFKLSKQTCAQAVAINQANSTLYYLLQLLKQSPPIELKQATVEEIITWGIKNWHPQALKGLTQIHTDGQ